MVRNDPFDREAPIELITPRRIESREFMARIRAETVPEGAVAIWFLGQNGFLIKASRGPLVAIDPYLTNSCAETFRDRFCFRLDRQLPVFVEPEDLDVDVFLLTHSHDDHADPETLTRYGRAETTTFIAPFDAHRRLLEAGVPPEAARLIHPGERIELEHLAVTATFALPTDGTDLNHIGYLLELEGGLTFYNSGDTAYCEGLSELLPREVHVATICINGGFHNLSAMEAARIVRDLAPRIAIPCHYDMMVNNVGSPTMFRAALEVVGARSAYRELAYYEPFLYSP